MRIIALDTETTGLNKTRKGRISDGHRIIEIACVEINNGVVTGKIYHTYVNPERKIDPEATKIHGITNKRIKGQPLFKDIVKELVEFIGGSELIIHNAPFDVEFLDKEFHLLSAKDRPRCTFFVTDTLKMARERYPGEDNTLNALSERFNIGIGRMGGVHGALQDALMLARVYLMMT